MKPIRLPLKTVNPLNKREHWAERMRRAKKEREIAYLATPPGLKTPITVKLTRFGPRLMDDDGLSASFKAIRDGIADKVGVDDGSSQIAFKYAQQRHRQFSIEVEFL